MEVRSNAYVGTRQMRGWGGKRGDRGSRTTGYMLVSEGGSGSQLKEGWGWESGFGSRTAWGAKYG
eukprot:761359-Hanusia_phi.AAC.1